MSAAQHVLDQAYSLPRIEALAAEPGVDNEGPGKREKELVARTKELEARTKELENTMATVQEWIAALATDNRAPALR